MGQELRVFSNGGRMRNRGVEASLTLQPIQSKDVNWIFRTTFFANTVKVTELNVPTFQTGGFALSLGTFQIEQDSSPTQIFGLVGTDAGGNPIAGKVGDANPDFQMSFSNDIDFHDFTLGFLFDWKYGGDIINLTEFLYDITANSKDYLESGGGADRINRFGAGFSDPYVQDGSYLKLREVNLSYNLPESWTSSLFGGGHPVRPALADRTQPASSHALSRPGSGSQQLRQPGDRAEHRCGSVPAESQLLLLDRLGVLTMTPIKLASAALLLTVFSAGACNYDISNPNSPDVIGTNPSAAQVGAAVNGILIATRQDVADWALDGAIFGREAYRIDPADPRFVQEMMQGPLDPGSRAFGGDHWLEPYSAIRSANDLLAVIGTASALTAEQQSAVSGFAHTLQAYNFMIVLSSHTQDQIPIDVGTDASAPPAPFVTNAEAWNHVIALLDQAAAELHGHRVSRSRCPPGSPASIRPATFLQFNRALRARVAVYRGDFAGALTFLGQSFLNTALPLETRCVHGFRHRPRRCGQPAGGQRPDQRELRPSLAADPGPASGRRRARPALPRRSW